MNYGTKRLLERAYAKKLQEKADNEVKVYLGNVTDEEVISELKAVENLGFPVCGDALDLIDRLKEENEELFYKLTGVMHSVDKWLDGKELEQDEVNRAATMREKTLKIVEELERKIDKLSKPAKKTCGNCVYSKPTTFGRSKVYVECKNPLHLAVYCKQGKNSHKRSRTHTACKDYLSKVVEA